MKYLNKLCVCALTCVYVPSSLNVIVCAVGSRVFKNFFNESINILKDKDFLSRLEIPKNGYHNYNPISVFNNSLGEILAKINLAVEGVDIDNEKHALKICRECLNYIIEYHNDEFYKRKVQKKSFKDKFKELMNCQKESYVRQLIAVVNNLLCRLWDPSYENVELACLKFVAEFSGCRKFHDNLPDPDERLSNSCKEILDTLNKEKLDKITFNERFIKTKRALETGWQVNREREEIISARSKCVC